MHRIVAKLFDLLPCGHLLEQGMVYRTDNFSKFHTFLLLSAFAFFVGHSVCLRGNGTTDEEDQHNNC